MRANVNTSFSKPGSFVHSGNLAAVGARAAKAAPPLRQNDGGRDGNERDYDQSIFGASSSWVAVSPARWLRLGSLAPVRGAGDARRESAALLRGPAKRDASRPDRYVMRIAARRGNGRRGVGGIEQEQLLDTHQWPAVRLASSSLAVAEDSDRAAVTADSRRGTVRHFA